MNPDTLAQFSKEELIALILAQKPNRAERRAGKRRKGHPGAFRQLSETPDRVVETLAAACPHCDHVLCAADQSEFHAYDHIDLPPIKRKHPGRTAGRCIAG